MPRRRTRWPTAAASGFVCLLAGCTQPSPPPVAQLERVFVDLVELERAHPSATVLASTQVGRESRLATPGSTNRVVLPREAPPLDLSLVYSQPSSIDLGERRMERVEERLTAVQASLNANNSRIVARERRGMQSKLDQEVASMREATEGAIRNGAALEAPPRDPAAVNLQLREIALESQVRVLSGSALEQAESELRSVRSRIETIEEARRGALALSEASIRQRAHQKVFDFRAEREAEMERKLDLRLEALRRADAERIRGYREALRGAVIAKPKAELAAPGEESIRAPAHGRPILPSLSGRQRPPSVTVGMAPSLRPEAVNELRNAVRFEVKQDATNAARRLGLDVRFEPEPGRRDYTREMISLLYGAGRQE